MNLKFVRCLNGICADPANMRFDIVDFFPEFSFDSNLVSILNKLVLKTLKTVPAARRPYIYEICINVDHLGIMSDNPLIEVDDDAEYSNVTLSANSSECVNDVFCMGDEIYYARCMVFAEKENKYAKGGRDYDFWEEMYYGRH